MRGCAAILLGLAFTLLAGTTGCSTQVRVSPLEAADDPVVNGLPFRSRERYQIKLYRLDGLTYQPVETKQQTATLASLSAIYVLRVDGSALSDGTVTVKMRSDNTLESVKVESKSKGQEALAAVGKGIKDLADAGATREKDASTKAAAAEATVVSDEDSRLAALGAKQAADLAVAELADLPATATQSQRTAAEQKIIKLRLVANQAARRAGLQAPFPDAGG